MVPHFTIEYSANVAEHHAIDHLVDVVHNAVLQLELASPAAARTRAVRREHYRVADQDDPHHAFIAITARIGPGRPAGVKQSIIQTVLDAGESHLLDEDTPLLIAWSMEVQEIDAEFRQNRNHIKASYDTPTIEESDR